MVAARAALLLAIGLNPYLLARHLRRGAGTVTTVTIWFISLIALNTALPVLLSVLGRPVDAAHLAVAHGACFAALASLALNRRLSLRPAPDPMMARAAGPLLVFALLVLPFTRMAGIDTYKWQDLASSVRLEQRIAWLVHPLSLFGYTPRSYPSAQPLLLATVQILGATGVDGGFYLVSLLCGAGCFFTALFLGRRVFAEDETAWAFAGLYLFSPIFLRYGFWATGRGFFLALYPLLLWGLLELRRPRGLAVLLTAAVLLPMTHKLGGIALVAVPSIFAVAFVLLPLRANRWLALALFVLSLLCAAVLAPGQGAARLLMFLWKPASRLALLVPLSLAGFFLVPAAAARPAWHAVRLGWLVTMPLVFAGEMYGALLALPLAAAMGAIGLTTFCRRAATGAPLVRRAVAGAVLLTGIVVIAHLSREATPEPVYQAARFLENHDPHGPYRIEAAGRTRTQIQGYVSGCPRFTVTPPSDATPRLRALPRLTGSLRRDYQHGINYLRAFVELPETATAWYGDSPRVYYVTGPGSAGPALPPNAVGLYSNAGVAVYTAEPLDNPIHDMRRP